MKELRRLAYEYIFLLAAEWYSEKKGYKTIEEFNENNNDLTTYRLAMYPFFFAMANGTSKSLYKLLGPFYSETDGPVAIGLLDIAFNRDFNDDDKPLSFVIFEPDFQKGLIVRPNIIEYIKNKESKKDINWTDIKELILKINSNVNEKKTSFKNITIKANDDKFKLLYEALDNSLKILKEQSNNAFITFDNQDFKILSYNYGLSLLEEGSLDYKNVSKKKVYYELV